MKNMKYLVGCAIGLSLLTSGCRPSKNLAYYSKLDSEDDIINPTVGQPGAVNGAKFVDGRVGNALYAPAGAENTVTVPFPDGLGSKGCIEFDAKIDDTGRDFRSGCDPFLFVFSRKATDPRELIHVMQMSFNANDGQGGSGLVFLGEFNYQIITWPSQFGRGKYSAIIPEDTDGWHHYRLVWNFDGLKDMNGDIAAVYIDGKLHKSGKLKKDRLDGYAKRYIHDPLTLSFSAGGRDVNGGGSKRAHLIDEFKVWNTDTPEE